MSADAKFWPADLPSATWDGSYTWAWVCDATDGVQDVGHSLDEAILAARVALSSGHETPLSMRIEARVDKDDKFYLAGWV